MTPEQRKIVEEMADEAAECAALCREVDEDGEWYAVQAAALRALLSAAGGPVPRGGPYTNHLAHDTAPAREPEGT